MAIIQNWLPPSRENWDALCWVWQFFPLVRENDVQVPTRVDMLTPEGNRSRQYNGSSIGIRKGRHQSNRDSTYLARLDGRRWNQQASSRYSTSCIHYLRNWGFTSCPGAIGLWLRASYVSPRMLATRAPSQQAPQVIHYIYRAVVAPLFLNPSMSPIHPLVWVCAIAFQMFNAISIGGWLAGHGPTTVGEWAGRYLYMEIGLVMWAWGLLGNIFHDDDLREIRRAADRKQRKEAEKLGKPVGSVDKIYMLPKNGLFQYALHAHYFCEWIEWAGFWMVGGWNCHPARAFLINEIATMTPRALQGKRWYEKKFGKDKVGNRKAVIPGVL